VIPAPVAYARPRSVEDAIALLEAHGEDARLLAGGHSLLPLMKLRLARVSHLIDLGRIEGLRSIRREGSQLCIGAMATHAAVAASELLAQAQPLLPAAAAQIGDVQVRNRGTLGGSLAHADPAADLIPAVLALDATLVVQGASGRRELAASEFFRSIYATALGRAEILLEVRVPAAPAGARALYCKVPHPASQLAVVGVAAELTVSARGVCEQARIALTGLAGIAYRASAAEQRLRGTRLGDAEIDAAAAAATAGIEPLADFYASAAYRLQLAQVACARALRELRDRPPARPPRRA